MNKCTTIKQEYERLKALKAEFKLEYEQATQSNALRKILRLKAKLEHQAELLENQVWPFEHLLFKELGEQYNTQKEILQKNGILETLSSGELGITAIDNKEYTFPRLEEVRKRVRENKEALQLKTEQGFNQLLVTPFGMKLNDLMEKYKHVILKHHREGTLLATKEQPTDSDEPLELNESEPLYAWEGYGNADVESKLIYFPQEFSSEKHGGKTKHEVLQKEGGFQIAFLEDLPNMPRKDKGKTKAGREQLEAGSTPNQYLQRYHTDPQYKHETGFTPEENIIYAMQHLERTNQVIDDIDGNGSGSYQLGAFFAVSGFVPLSYWYRDARRASLYGFSPGSSNVYYGVRGAVRV